MEGETILGDTEGLIPVDGGRVWYRSVGSGGVPLVLLHGGHFDFFEEGHRAAACPANYIGRIDRPVFFVNSETDGDCLPETAILPIHLLAGPSAEIRWTTAGGHGALNDNDLSAVAAWLRDKLR